MTSKILLVEDEISLRDLYQEIIKDAGYEVDTAMDGETAVQKIESGGWDFLVLDIMLPKLDGLEILKKVKSNPELKAKPVMVFSNLDNQDLMDQCKSLGVESYIVKSNTDPAKFIEEIQKYLPNA